MAIGPLTATAEDSIESNREAHTERLKNHDLKNVSVRLLLGSRDHVLGDSLRNAGCPTRLSAPAVGVERPLVAVTGIFSLFSEVWQRLPRHCLHLCRNACVTSVTHSSSKRGL